LGTLGQRGAEWQQKKELVSLTGSVKSHFFVTGQISMKFQQKMSVGACIEP